MSAYTICDRNGRVLAVTVASSAQAAIDSYKRATPFAPPDGLQAVEKPATHKEDNAKWPY